MTKQLKLRDDGMPKVIFLGKLEDQFRRHFALSDVKESCWQRMVLERVSWRALKKAAGRTWGPKKSHC